MYVPCLVPRGQISGAFMPRVWGGGGRLSPLPDHFINRSVQIPPLALRCSAHLSLGQHEEALACLHALLEALPDPRVSPDPASPQLPQPEAASAGPTDPPRPMGPAGVDASGMAWEALELLLDSGGCPARRS